MIGKERKEKKERKKHKKDIVKLCCFITLRGFATLGLACRGKSKEMKEVTNVTSVVVAIANFFGK